MSSNDGEEALLVWVKSFPDAAAISSLSELSTGRHLAQICAKIDAKHFSAEWISRFSATSVENVHLCQLNSSKLIDKVLEYYSHCLQCKSNPFPIISELKKILKFFFEKFFSKNFFLRIFFDILF